MGINIGLDIGSISLKLAALGRPADRGILEQLCAGGRPFRMASGPALLALSDYRRIAGSPIQSAYDLLRDFYDVVPEDRVEGIRVTGSGSRTIAKILGLYFENEFKAIARMIAGFHPQVRTVFEIGGESSKYIRLEKQTIQDYDRSGECAAGTGSFLDQQALRMRYSVEEVGDLVAHAGCAARIAGRCSVFAKSDMIHAQQKGHSPPEILRGLCDAVARNFKSSVVKGRRSARPRPPARRAPPRAGAVIHDIYLRTSGRPIEAVQQGLAELESLWGSRLDIRGVGATGSGRELIAEFAGADVVNDEITAHKTGAIHVSQTMGGEPVDTIFEIGGQDSKFISIENGVVVDFAMNEACAAGTGSFLEEQAEKLGISIKGEFARLALAAPWPTRLGERCTVFMERDVSGWLHKGEPVPNLLAGLAYSIALNYLNRVVRGRHIGNAIYFQGGTAYNDAVAAAFAGLLGKRITVPPYNGVMGAIGMALIARQWHRATHGQTRFRGYHLDRLHLASRDFVCRACSNLCDIKEFTIEGQKSYWGDKCSDKFRKPSATGRQPVIDDLFACREKIIEDLTPATATGGVRVGIPRAMSTFDRYPFWQRYFAELGIATVLSPVTDPRIAAAGVEMAVAQPCYPVQVAHGHVRALAEMGVDYILTPNIADAESDASDCPSHYCPWNQTLPYILRVAPGLAEHAAKFLVPTLHFQLGPGQVKGALAECMQPLGVSRRASDRAADAAYTAQREFQDRLLELGRRALLVLEQTGEPGLVLAGRGYNIYDRGINCDIPRKLRHRYGANVIPLDFLVTGREPMTGLHQNMYWASGRKILEAARVASSRANLHVIYLSNFKCGPDSYIKHFAREAAGAPLLVLQFDGHGNDAGYMTRCEAYLDSKGILRCYKPALALQALSLSATC